MAVAEVLSAAGVTVAANDLDVPAAVTSSSPAPALRLTGAQPVDNDHLRLRFICDVPGQCLPFFVVLQSRGIGAAERLASQFTLKVSAGQPIKEQGGTVLHAGTPAMLLIETHHMRITIPVVSIDTGAPGTEVRVASLDHKQIYRGVVGDNSIVRGNLP